MTTPAMPTLAAKCAPDPIKLREIDRAGITAVEIYLSHSILQSHKEVRRICADYPMRYALHAPEDGFDASLLADLAGDLGATIIVLHDSYWDEEWASIASALAASPSLTPCIENTVSAHQPLRFMRKFGYGMCLDFEHLQMEVCGIFPEMFRTVATRASHVHMTGYGVGTELWHTHLHHGGERTRSFLDLLASVHYRGMVVSEAAVVHQSLEEFRQLREFFDAWCAGTSPA